MHASQTIQLSDQLASGSRDIAAALIAASPEGSFNPTQRDDAHAVVVEFAKRLQVPHSRRALQQQHHL